MVLSSPNTTVCHISTRSKSSKTSRTGTKRKKPSTTSDKLRRRDSLTWPRKDVYKRSERKRKRRPESKLKKKKPRGEEGKNLEVTKKMRKTILAELMHQRRTNKKTEMMVLLVMMDQPRVKEMMLEHQLVKKLMQNKLNMKN